MKGSPDASVVIDFAGGQHLFRLAIGEWQKVEAARNLGPAEIWQRLFNGTWRIEDMREVIRWGLIGGGKTPTQAAEMLRDFVDANAPLLRSLALAQQVATAGWIGADDEAETELKKNGESDATQPNGSTISPTDESAGASSTGSVQSSATHRERSIQ